MTENMVRKEDRYGVVTVQIIYIEDEDPPYRKVGHDGEEAERKEEEDCATV